MHPTENHGFFIIHPFHNLNSSLVVKAATEMSITVMDNLYVQ